MKLNHQNNIYFKNNIKVYYNIIYQIKNVL